MACGATDLPAPANGLRFGGSLGHAQDGCSWTSGSAIVATLDTSKLGGCALFSRNGYDLAHSTFTLHVQTGVVSTQLTETLSIGRYDAALNVVLGKNASGDALELHAFFYNVAPTSGGDQFVQIGPFVKLPKAPTYWRVTGEAGMLKISYAMVEAGPYTPLGEIALSSLPGSEIFSSATLRFDLAWDPFPAQPPPTVTYFGP